MPKITLSHQAHITLHTIYQEYLIRLNNNSSDTNPSHFTKQTIISLFPNVPFDEILPSLVELCKNHLIHFYTDGSVILNSYATIYFKPYFKHGFPEKDT